MIGKTIGPYQVVAKLGAGGMGEVYRARDTKLNRDVALKVLPEAFTADPDRLVRFKREAQVLASLNHPNVAAIRMRRLDRWGRVVRSVQLLGQRVRGCGLRVSHRVSS